MSNRKITNPFLINKYVSPDYFCDREKETDTLISALKNGRNITLISPRRMGKTGLIKNAFHNIGNDGYCFYLDIYQTKSFASFVKMLGKAVLGSIESEPMKLLQRVAQAFRSLRPSMSIDGVTGEPSLSLDIVDNEAEKSLEEILGYLEKADKPCYIAIDEFQAIATYPETQTEALLRSHIQQMTNVQFIFAGSERHVMINMFGNASRPFYQSTQTMHIDVIDREKYLQFAQRLFSQHERQITDEAFYTVYDRMQGHTWYVQYICNRLFELGDKTIDKPTVETTIVDIINEYEGTFYSMNKLLSVGQLKLLTAIAQEYQVKEVLSNKFLQSHALGAASSVRTAHQALLDKDMLIDNMGTTTIYDKFYAEWLRK